VSELEAVIRRIVREELERLLRERAAPAPATPELISIGDAAARLGMSRSFIRAAIREGRLPIERIGRAVRLRPADVDALRTRRRDAVAPGARTTAEIADAIMARKRKR
jgi:excisionase family DNA binding protein